MANEEQLAILKQGSQAWNAWRDECMRKWTFDPNVDAVEDLWLLDVDLTNADLSGMRLGEMDLDYADLSGADLSRSYLTHSSLYKTKLRGANLSGAALRHSRFSDVDLSEANLGGAILSNSIFIESSFTAALLKGTTLARTTFLAIDLKDTYSLDEVDHRAASRIDVDTLRLSMGKIPDIFLRVCGFSDLEIQYAKLATPGLDPEQVTDITYKIHQLYLRGGLQYYSCFISYNNKDEHFAHQLHNDLQDNGVRCWFAPEDMKIGDPIRPRIDQEIRLRDKLLVILSENSVKSEWVGDEVEAALEEESKTGRLVLFPIRLDDTVMSTRDDWAAKIQRRRHIGDFSNWKDKASYQKAFARLLQDLKATGGGVHGE